MYASLQFLILVICIFTAILSQLPLPTVTVISDRSVWSASQLVGEINPPHDSPGQQSVRNILLQRSYSYGVQFSALFLLASAATCEQMTSCDNLRSHSLGTDGPREMQR